ncbi:hypothetical protein GCM10009425_23970 [Pseudomonas asuensis]|uniref:EAL domain-containing protein n=1 Tax=Pseudomonas asuensis TaxID=1825787 RepID=A0ABQ2GUB1_9PSED|nr:EAL domain-containing protein [Pseudomonas asuensis]GGM12199.1 hypothetical protein GCM10009425_23970 [Pseudomonas asuensis]
MRTFHPFRLAGLYALIGIAWVGVTDYLLDHASLSTSTLSALQTVKGIVFVCGIAVLLYFHIRREQRARQQLIDELQRHVEQLQQTLGTTAQTTNEQPPLQPPIQTEAEAPHYQDILDHLPLVAFLIDLDGHWRFLSSAWERLTQKAISQTVGGSVFQCFHSQENQSIQQMLNEFRDGTRHDWSATLRLCQVDGSHRWISFKIHKVIDEGLQGTITDIHHQFQADELQRARNAVLDELLQGHTKSSILTGIAKRLEGIFPEMRVIIQLADGSRKKLSVSAAPSLPDTYIKAIEDSPIAPDSGTCGAAVYRNGLVVSEDIEQDPNWIGLREAALQADIRSGWSLPIRDETESAVGVFGIYYYTRTSPEQATIALVNEFTRLAALAIRQQRYTQERDEIEHRFRATFEHAAIGIALVGLDYKWMRANRYFCQMVGYAHDDLQNLTIHDITYPEDLPLGAKQVEELLAGKRDSYELEKRYARQDGRVIWADLNVTLIRSTQGEPQYFIAVIEDITLRKAQQESLRQAAALFENSRDSIVVLDQQRRILLANPTFQALCNRSIADLQGQQLPLPQGGRQDHNFYRTLWRTLLREGHWEGEVLWRRPNGMNFPGWLTISQIWQQDQRQFVMVLSDTSQLKESEARLAHLAHFDPLTDLPNRLLARTRLDHALKRLQGEGQLAVLLLDLDHFRTINESYGHPAGDDLINAVADTLRSGLRPEDTLARIGGDEFLVILEQFERLDEVATLAQNLRQLFEAPLRLADGQEVFLSLSLGISVHPSDGATADELIRNADAAMHLAKNQGRNTYRFYTQALTDQARRRLSMESRLRVALQRCDFVLYYQPLIDVATGQPIGAEALVRWRDPEFGMISPADFIPLAEETGLIIPLGFWILEQACHQIREWLDKGLELDIMAVNLSPRQFAQADLAERITKALNRQRLPANKLELEITEGTLMENVEMALTSLAALKTLGVRIAVDDFGTGYSSLAYLRRFPLDKLKIDQSFMRDIRTDNGEHGNQAIASAIIALGHSLHLDVLAEGVETDEQLEVIRKLGCQQCQGYLFSPPLPPEAFEKWYYDYHRSLT